jgi:YD repeat-containing protein
MLDAAGRLRSLINPLGQKTVSTPDALDRIALLTDAINGVTQFGYDPNSNLLTVIDAKSQTPTELNTGGMATRRPCRSIIVVGKPGGVMVKSIQKSSNGRKSRCPSLRLT